MANDLRYIGTVTDGQLKISHRKQFDADLGGFEGSRVIISLRKYRKTRSNKQNRFYWGNFMQEQIECFKERWGETYRKEQVHEWNKANFWAEDHVDENTGEVVKMPASSTDYSTTEWEEKMEIIRQWFRQVMEWELPFPEQQTEIDY